jgi:hypothetical protein
LQILAANDLYSYNKLSELDKLKPEEKKFQVRASKLGQTLAPYSLTVLKIPYSSK